jgi:hypothetical protein
MVSMYTEISFLHGDLKGFGEGNCQEVLSIFCQNISYIQFKDILDFFFEFIFKITGK